MSDAQEKPPERKVINMIWANESGRSIYIFEAEHGRCVIEIHGVVGGYETVLATATVEKHNRERLSESISTRSVPAGAERVAEAQSTERGMNPWDEAVAIAKQVQVDYAGWPDIPELIVRALTNRRDESTERCAGSAPCSQCARYVATLEARVTEELKMLAEVQDAVWDEAIRIAKSVSTVRGVEDYAEPREPLDVKSEIVAALEAARNGKSENVQHSKEHLYTRGVFLFAVLLIVLGGLAA